MEQASRVQAVGQIWRSLSAVADLLGTRPERAEERARELVAFMPGHQQGLQVLVSARRARGDMAGARAILEAMVAQWPALAAVHYELGLLLADLGDRDAAIEELSRVVELEPEHAMAWRALGEELAEKGDRAAAARALARHGRSSIADVKMLEDVAALGLDKIGTAMQLLREYVYIGTTDVNALRTLADVYMRANQLEAAEGLYARALELAPGYSPARVGYVAALHGLQKWNEQIVQLDILLGDDPVNQECRYHKAMALFRVGQFAEAMAYCEEIMHEEPKNSRYCLAYAYAQRSAGRTEGCIAAFRKSLELDPGLGESWLGLANLKTFHFAASDVDAMRAQLARTDLPEDERIHLNFAFAKGFEDQKAYEKAFEQYSKVNKQKRALYNYDPDEVSAHVRRIKTQYTSELFRGRERQGSPARDPIFIVGLPRSGSTLIEQILCSHSQVEGCGELRDIASIATRLEAKEGGSQVSLNGTIPTPLQGADVHALGEEYLERTRVKRKLGRPFFVDKMPHNFLHVGFIRAILPNARIIDVRRHPLACCMSNFRQNFAAGAGPSYDLAHMARYYCDYVELMAHFDAVLPGRVHRVIYEDMVRDPEGQTRRLLDYCGLPFEEACLRFYETDRTILTISSEQVRQPIYDDSVELWRPFERWLGPLKAALGPVLDSYPSVPERF
jgi:tetratricopeptide (TPR) repeat protein